MFNTALVFIGVSIYIVSIVIYSFYEIYKTKRSKDKIRAKVRNESSQDYNAIYEATEEVHYYKYYEYLRDEIQREDELTHQRITWIINLNSFLINAFGILLVFSWDHLPPDIALMRRVAIIVVGIVGLTSAVNSITGISAARRSLEEVKIRWERLNEKWKLYPNKAPQAYAQRKPFSSGRHHSIMICYTFVVMWVIFLAGYMIIYTKYKDLPQSIQTSQVGHLPQVSVKSDNSFQIAAD